MKILITLADPVHGVLSITVFLSLSAAAVDCSGAADDFPFLTNL